MQLLVPKSIRQKIIALTLGVSMGVLVLCGAIFFLYESQSLRAAKVRDSQILAETISSTVAAALAFNDVSAAEEILAATKADPQIERIQVLNHNGTVFATYSPHLQPGLSENSRIELTAPILIDGRTIGQVFMSRGLGDVAKSLDDLLLVGTIILLGAALIAVSLVSRLEPRITRPIIHLADITRTVSENRDYSVRAIMTAQDETATLIDGFNRMLREIETRDNQLRAAQAQLEERVVERTRELQSEIVERSRAEVALAQEQQQLRILIQTAPVSIAMFDNELKYLAHSDQWRTDFDVGSGPLIGRSHYDVFPDLTSRWRTIFSNALKGSAQSRTEDTLELRGGLTRHIRWSLQPWHLPDGSRGGVLMVAIVIDELVNAREAALKVMRVRTEFLANMSHELRTPLNGIIGFTELLLDSHDSPSEEREQLETIQSSAKHLLGLVSEVLDFSKLESNKLDLETIPFSPAAVVTAVCQALSPQALQQNLTLEQIIAPNATDQVNGDPTRVRQVLTNLIGNALKFTDAGSITVRVSLAQLSGSTAELSFSVTDTGIGIPLDKQASVFEAFVQADGSTTRKYGGTGLGLAICRRLAEAMHGKISLESRPGRGSTFTFTCRVQTVGREVVSAKPTISKETNVIDCSLTAGLRVLVAEDNMVNQKLIVALLKKAGVITTLTGNGHEALKKLQSDDFDLVLMDLQMPEMGGIEATRLIRQLDHKNKIPIVALTAHAFPEDQAHCREVGMNCYLTKPIDRSVLLDVLAQVKKDPSGASLKFL